VIITFVAIAISSNYQVNLETALAPGQTASVGDYELTFERLQLVEEPHLTAQRATIRVTRSGRDRGVLEPSLNHYPTQREPIGTPKVKTSLTHDLYLTVMNIGEDGSLGLRAIVTPAVVWIWIGVLIMVVGTVICLVPPRTTRVTETAPTMEAATP
jgi:cytochrome c-type biogenesis protein CcmF